MRVLQLSGVTLGVILAFSSVIASTASAEFTLLAEWLISGATVTALTSVTSASFLVIEDLDVGARVECDMLFDGSIGPNGEGETTEALTTGGVLITLSAPLLCKSETVCEESTTDITAVPEISPWHNRLYLTESGHFRVANQNLATYIVSCLDLGIKITDECSVQNGSVEVKNATGGVEFVGATSPRGNCSIGGMESGDVNYISGNVMILLTGTLTVSSE
jgi:hypothetical protein